AARTAFAIDPVYISLEALDDFQQAGGTAALPAELRSRLEAARASEQIRWEDVRPLKDVALRMAFRHFAATAPDTGRMAALEAFARHEADWLPGHNPLAPDHR